VIECFIGLGGNLGDRMGNLSVAVSHLMREPALFLRRVSRVYETEPVGPPQPRYLNAVAQVDTLLSARALLRVLFGVEEAMGRVRRERWTAREIDLDLLLFGDRVIDGPFLQVPHPQLEQRAFVLVPLCELAPQAVHPRLNVTFDELRQRLPDSDLAGVRAVGPLRPSAPAGPGEPGDDVPHAQSARPR
jgi:2-amino-4-hydroxy-6-hydroxymethyldihydropteridine diphosphokinase